jgi:hypothetical protein
LPILLFAPLYNVPRFFEFETLKNTTYSCIDNSSNFGQNLFVDSQNNSSLQQTRIEPELLGDSDESTGIVYSEETFLSQSKSDLKSNCTTWHKKIVIELLVTDFRVDPIYVSVSRFKTER